MHLLTVWPSYFHFYWYWLSFLEQFCSCSEFSDSGLLSPETSSKKNKVNLFRKRSDRSETSLLMGKIKIDGFVEKFDRILWMCFSADSRINWWRRSSLWWRSEQLGSVREDVDWSFWKGRGIGKWFVQNYAVHVLSRFWMNESDLSQRFATKWPQELIRLLQLSTLAGSTGIRGMLIALKCKNFWWVFNEILPGCITGV